MFTLFVFDHAKYIDRCMFAGHIWQRDELHLVHVHQGRHLSHRNITPCIIRTTRNPYSPVEKLLNKVVHSHSISTLALICAHSMYLSKSIHTAR